jgi:hypothetical protein
MLYEFNDIYNFLPENLLKFFLFISVFLILFYVEKLNYTNNMLYNIAPVLPIAKQTVNKVSSRNKKKR